MGTCVLRVKVPGRTPVLRVFSALRSQFVPELSPAGDVTKVGIGSAAAERAKMEG